MKQLIRWAALTLLSTLIIGVTTGFQFSKLDIQLYDTYYVFESFYGIILLTLVFGTGWNFYLLTDLITDRYKILALMLSIINIIAGLFVLIGAYFSIKAVMALQKINSGTDLSGYFLLPTVLIGLLIVQIIVEIKLIRKLREVWTS